MFNHSIRLRRFFGIALMVWGSCCFAEKNSALENLLLQASDGDTLVYIHPSDDELNRSEVLFRQMFRGNTATTLKNSWNELGFELVNLEANGKEFMVVHERKDKKQGRGFYAFQKNKRGNLLQAPHSFKDLNTREIALQMFLLYTFSAAGWNTVPRTLADFAHLPSTYFMAFSSAFAKEYPKGYVIQLHGFAQNKHNYSDAANAHIVISAGRQDPPPSLLNMGACLKNKVNSQTLIYPLEISDLSATTNDIGKMLRAMNHNGFVHLEMSAKMRLALLEDQTLLNKLNGCMP